MTDFTASQTATIQAHSFLTLHYRLTLEEQGEQYDIVNTFRDKPATLQLGQGQLAHALEQKLLGLTVGAHQSFKLDGAAYGPRNPDLVQRITRSLLDKNSPAKAEYTPGDLVEFPAPNGIRYTGILKELDDHYALFDFNHPLAGKALLFEVQILGIL